MAHGDHYLGIGRENSLANGSTPEELEEERRLLYVATTRQNTTW